MVSMFPGGDPGRSAPGWQDSGIDVEISRVNYGGAMRFQWALYHEARLIRTGMSRSMRGARFAGGFAEWWYRLWN